MIDPSLPAAVKAIASLEGEFRLRSGQISSTYFDKYRFEAAPELLRRVAAEMIPLVPKQCEVLAGLELGGVPIATAISLAMGLRAAFVRKKAKEYGTCLAVEGGSVKGRRFVLYRRCNHDQRRSGRRCPVSRGYWCKCSWRRLRNMARRGGTADCRGTATSCIRSDDQGRSARLNALTSTKADLPRLCMTRLGSETAHQISTRSTSSSVTSSWRRS